MEGGLDHICPTHIGSIPGGTPAPIQGELMRKDPHAIGKQLRGIRDISNANQAGVVQRVAEGVASQVIITKRTIIINNTICHGQR